MALNKSILENGILDLQKRNPKTIKEVADRWSSVYHSYSLTGTAAGLIPTGLVREAISSSILATPTDFFEALSRGAVTYWMAALWVAPGFTGVTTNAVGLNVELRRLGAEIINRRGISSEESSIRIADSIHRYTRGVLITITNISTSATLVSNIE